MAIILVVDDEVGIRELLSEILIDEGYDVRLAENATRTGDVETSETEGGEAPTREKEEASDVSEVDWEEILERSPGDFHGSIGTGSDRDDNRASFIENTAASNGDYTATVESTVTADLTDGAMYTVRVTISSGAYNDHRRIPHRACYRTDT